ncbi:AEL324Cp [Eremothecium gossypii ATCC 10895]|uniref:Pre-mRNA-splicing factor SNT309 n=1 Tax=Eremothecium gossypii (strain ATCC 10895 / CBS 109.51 / FGSC 9923 / NRRL Y-1056) TaxID=284811 RepID=SN309_EREGS|nr:AEL324Cp [Eremothecium gossypii ATCC 10895]Q758S6.1 RecName: Full=Pre-mRNA-splicing factor SNT309 [Eremothecium gossypii ATCC 10895]AAS52360.1 AEL324Cp [Eremothecium gossypii ATCC 10895]AEY96657.1 FAEL324Cp [Eremothecium gossypii FDAG1]
MADDVIDWLPYVDTLDQRYLNEVEKTVTAELAAIEQQELHPRIAELFPAVRHHWDEQYGLYKDNVVGLEGSNKRAAEDGVLSELKRRCPGIDISVYNDDSEDPVLLATIAGYRYHQDLVVTQLLPQTLENQWAINNAYLEGAEAAVRRQLQEQEQQIAQLDRHRQELQQREALRFRYLERQWRDRLHGNLERAAGNI